MFGLWKMSRGYWRLMGVKVEIVYRVSARIEVEVENGRLRDER